MKQWHAWLELARISNLPTVWTNVLAGWLLAGGEWRWGTLAWLLAGGSLMYTAGMILNDAMDVKFDREHRKERPIPSGRVSVPTAWCVGIGMLLGGGAMCYLGARACGWLVLALVAAILAYDAFHKPWAGSVFIMGSCRTLLYLVAGSAVTGGLSWEGNQELVVKAVALGGYIVGVSLVARSEAATSAPKKMQLIMGSLMLCLPFVALVISVTSPDGVRVFFIAGMCLGAWAMVTSPSKAKPEASFRGCLQLGSLIILSVVLLSTFIPSAPHFFEEHMGMLMGAFARLAPIVICAAILMWLVERAIQTVRTPPPSNLGRAVSLLLAGIVVVDGLAISLVSPLTALVVSALMPLLLLWQRKIAAT